MGCEVQVFREKQISYDCDTSTAVIERETLLDLKSWELGERLTQETECPNGSVTTVLAEQVLDGLLSYAETDECKDDKDIKDEVMECISQVRRAEAEHTDCLSVSVWY